MRSPSRFSDTSSQTDCLSISVVRVTESCTDPVVVRKGKADKMGLVPEASKDTMETDA